jgi:hypothetical protein
VADKDTLFDEKWQAGKLASHYKNIADGVGNHNPATCFFMQLLNKQIAEVENKAKRAKLHHNTLAILGLLFSGLTTLILGLKLSQKQNLGYMQENIALIFSTSATFVAGIAGLLDISNYYFRIKVMYSALKLLRYRFVLDVKESKTGLIPDQIGQYEQQLVAIVGDGYWAGRRSKNTNGKKNGQEQNIIPADLPSSDSDNLKG